MKRFLLTILCLSVSTLCIAQGDGDKEKREVEERKINPRPDLPGSLIFDLGFNFLSSDAPDDLDIGFWGSKSVGIYYYFNKKLGNSKFSINPGIGLGLEKYKFDKDVTLSYTTTTTIPIQRELAIFGLDSLIGPFNYSKSKLAANYVEVPAELRYHVKQDHDGGFRIVLGGKIGILYSAHTKVKYKEFGNNKKVKLKQDYQLNLFRYSVYTRVGWPGFMIFYELGLSDLFEKGNGPEQTTAHHWKIGLSVTIF
ncbi:MAG: porin family protein [Bacteroidetes bacterium]|nr:porin family protein [Bacteroidota bacterium]